MQVESSFMKYAGRIPPLDLSQVNTNCRNENELQHLWSSKANSPSALKRVATLRHPYLHLTHTPAHTYSAPATINNNSCKNNIGDSSTSNKSNSNSNFNTILPHNTCLQQLGSDGLPLDPRDWTRADVWKWLINMALSEGLEVTPELPQKFPMNGKALCLMSLDMYLCRVPVGGKMLYRDFRVRLARAMALLSKQTGSFVNDPSAINLIQLSPRTEFQNERNPYTMANHSSKTNFIGDTVMHEGPRAVAVSETGEKHSIHLEEDNMQTNLNPFTVASQSSQVFSMPNSTVSSTKISGFGNECSRLITTKRSKGSRRHSNQKTRPIFTPRNIDKIPTRFFNDDLKVKPVSPHMNVQTQTETISSYSALAPRAYHQPPVVPPLQIPRRYMPRETVGDMLDSSRRQPLRVLPLPREKKSFKNYSELRSIASALTLITVVSWLFSIFFELESMFDMLGGILRFLTNWYNKEEPPMTKVEMLVQFARNLW